jgi:hypothetical protein
MTGMLVARACAKNALRQTSPYLCLRPISGHLRSVPPGSLFAGSRTTGPGRAPQSLTLSRTRSARRIFSGQVRDWRLFCHCAWRLSISPRSLIQEPAFKSLPGAGQTVPDGQTPDNPSARPRRTARSSGSRRPLAWHSAIEPVPSRPHPTTDPIVE